MNEPERTNGRAVIAAAGAAVALLLASGAGYRVAAEYLALAPNSIPLAPGTLAGLPMRIGDWAGRDVPLSEAVIRATATDDHVNRAYSPPLGGQTVWVFVAYGVRARDLAPHRPEVCYPGSGWTLEDSREAHLPLAGAAELRCRILRFSRGGLTAGAVTVLNYYIVDGQYCPDLSLVRSRAWRGSRGLGYMAQVQIACPAGDGSSADAAAKSASAFAIDSAAAIKALLPSAGETVQGDGEKAPALDEGGPPNG